jgi:SAM-dependent methyltransferase
VTGTVSLGAGRWVDRWERQQERYAIDREARFTAMVDVVEHATRGVRRPLVVDLGSGPGSLAHRMVDRLPDAEVVAVDADPFLLELGRAGRPQAVRYVRATIGEEGWVPAMALDRAPDVVASATALHYLPAVALLELYRDLAALLPAEGVFVNGDHLPPRDLAVAAFARAVAARSSTEVTEAAAGDVDDWTSWWAGVADDPQLGPALAATGRHGPAVDGDHSTPAEDHVDLLLAAGFRAASPVWRSGPSAVMVAVR